MGPAGSVYRPAEKGGSAMRIPLNAVSIFITVTVGALLGMLLGGGFGLAAGCIGPDLFKHLLPWEEFEPVGVATVLGAAAGVVCGAALAIFAIFVEACAQWLTARKAGHDAPAGERRDVGER